MIRFIKISILLSMGIFLYTRLTNGSIYFYINDRFITLTLLAAVGFIIVGLSFFYPQLVGHQHAHTHDDGHNHGDISWLGLLIVALPVVLGFVVPPQPLGASALGNREINIGTLSSLPAPSSGNSMGLVTGEKNILDWLHDFQRNPDPAIFNGVEANIIGFVYRDERFTEKTFMVSRFTVSCCVADAAPIGLVVQSPESPDLAEDTWVQVNGTFTVSSFNGTDMPVLVADEITLAEQPEQPYLYP